MPVTPFWDSETFVKYSQLEALGCRQGSSAAIAMGDANLPQEPSSSQLVAFFGALVAV